MPKQPEAHRSSARRSVFLLLACPILTFVNLPRLGAQTAAPTKPGQAAAVIDALKISFGSTLEAAKGFKPFYLTGDFNSDGAQDVCVVVHIKSRPRELPPDVKVVNPFYQTDSPAYPTDPVAKPTLALAIIHGTKAGWQTPQPAGKFLLVGESPILILEYDRATSGRPDDAKGLMEIMTKRVRRRRGQAWPPAAATGDSIILETEAINSILYWNGKTYRWEESEGGE